MSTPVASLPIPPASGRVQMPLDFGWKALVFGPPGSGKTHALRSIKEELLIFFVEPGMEVLMDTDPAKVHWVYRPPVMVDWKILMDNAKLVSNFDIGALQKMPGMNKPAYGGAYINLLSAAANFKCERCGKVFGDIAYLGIDKTIAFDSMSGLNKLFLDHAVGGKPVRSQPDWGVAMDNEENFIILLCMGMKANVVVNAHADREADMLGGGTKIMPAALGSKLPPKIGRFFSDVVFTRGKGPESKWSTVTSGVDADTKARNLPWADNLPQDFGQLTEARKLRELVKP